MSEIGLIGVMSTSVAFSKRITQSFEYFSLRSLMKGFEQSGQCVHAVIRESSRV